MTFVKSLLRNSACALLLASAALVTLPVHDQAHAQASVTVQFAPGAPPPPRGEVVPAPPRGRHLVWVPGRWNWDGHGWVWVAGRYRAPPHGRAGWVPGHWEQRGPRWFWVQGHWR